MPGYRLRFIVGCACFVIAPLWAQSLPGTRALRNPDEIGRTVRATRGRDVNVELEVKYADHHIDNPATGGADAVHLRSYSGELVGPTIRVKPGDTLNLKLVNHLPSPDASCPASG